jgi:hypothetical protein
MCERKPGPRCSADVKKSLEAAQKVITDFDAKYPAHRKGGELPEGVTFPGYLEVNLLTWQYEATPEGLKELKQKAITAHENGESRSEVLLGGRGPKVVLNLPKADEYTAQYEVASAHRKWQSDTLKSLESIEKEKGFIAASDFATLLSQKISAATAELKAKRELEFKKYLADRDNYVRTAIENSGLTNSEDRIPVSPEQQGKYNKANVRWTKQYEQENYARIKQADLKDYIDGVGKRIEAHSEHDVLERLVYQATSDSV